MHKVSLVVAIALAGLAVCLWMLQADAPRETPGASSASTTEVDTSPSLRGRSTSRQAPDSTDARGEITSRWATARNGTRQLRGRVVRPDGAPAPGARVAVHAVEPTTDAFEVVEANGSQGGEWQRVRSFTPALGTTRADDDGRFAITVRDNARMKVDAASPGVGRGWAWVPPATAKHEEIVLKLAPGTTLALRVIDESHAPVPNVQVRISAGVLDPVQAGRTDAHGRVTFDHVQAEWVDVLSVLAATSVGDGAWEFHDVPRPERGRETTLRIHRGRPLRVHVKGLTPTQLAGGLSCRIRTTVTGAGLAYAETVAALDAEGRGTLHGVRNGAIEELALFGPTLPYHALGLDDLRLSTPYVAPDTAIVVVEALPTAGITGTALLDGGAPAAHARVALLRYDDSRELFGEVAWTDANAHGRFAFPNLPPGEYGLVGRCEHPRAFGAQPVPIGGGPFAALVFARSGTAPEDVTLHLQPAGAIEGHVRGLTMPGDVRSAVAYAGGLRLAAWVTAEGRFQLPWVPALSSVEIRTEGGWRELSATADVEAGSTAVVVLEGAETLQVTGHVRNARGTPVADAALQLSFWSSRWPHPSLPTDAFRTDAEGRFEVPFRARYDGKGRARSLQRWTLDVSHEDYRGKRVELPDDTPRAPTANEPIELEVVLQDWGPHGLLRGTVLQADGRPAWGASVTLTRNGVRDDEILETGLDGTFRARVTPTDEATYVEVEHETGGYEGPMRPEDATSPLVLRLSPRVSVRGWLVDDEGRPISEYVVRAYPAEAAAHLPDGRSRSARPSTHPMHDEANRLADFLAKAGASRAEDTVYFGEFDFLLEPGPYLFVFLGAASSSCSMLWTAHGPVEATREPLVVPARMGKAITGRVTNEAGEVLSRAVVIAAYPGAPDDTGSKYEAHRPMAFSRADGRYTLAGLTTSRLQLLVWKEGFQPTLVGPVHAPGTLDIVLPRGARLEGRLVRPDGTPWIGVELAAEHDDEDEEKREDRLESLAGGAWLYDGRSLGPKAITDAQGRFRFSGLARIPHKIELENGVSDGDAVLPKKAFPVDRGPLHLVAPPAQHIRGRIDGRHGYAQITATRDGEVLANDSTWTPGQFTLEGLPPGTIEITARMRGAETVTTVVNSGTHDVEIRFR